MSHTSGLNCCGITELANIYDDDDPVDSIMELEPSDQAIVIFSDINANRRGDVKNYQSGYALAKLIGDAKLGVVVYLAPKVNPNTGNKVKVWAWSVNRRALRSYQKKIRAKYPERYRLDAYDPYRSAW